MNNITKNSLCLFVLLLGGQGGFLHAESIENATYKVTLDKEASAISIVFLPTGDEFIQATALPEEVQDVEVQNTTGPKEWGKGSLLSLRYKNGDSAKITLHEHLDLILYQAEFKNLEDGVRVIGKDKPFELNLNITDHIQDFRTISTAGLQNAKVEMGGYMVMGLGHATQRNGIVCGWISSDAGSGIINIQAEGQFMVPHVDYGGLRVQPGESRQGELLAFGYFDDIRMGLESYADAVSSYYEINLRPLPGVYCTWYHAKASDEVRLAANADFAHNHLLDYGLGVMQIDDRWQGDIRKKQKTDKKHNGPIKNFSGIGPEGYYKSGMKAAADNLKAEGFTPGIWFMPFSGTFDDPYFADKQHLFYKDESGKPYDVFWGGTQIDMTHPESLAYLKENVTRFAHEWGYKYFKMDGLFTGLGVRIRYPNQHYREDNLGEPTRYNMDITPVESYRNAMTVIRETAGDDIFFLGCNVAQSQRTMGASYGLVDAMRVGPDNGTNWDHWKTEGKIVGTLKAGPLYAGRVYFLHGRVWWNDPDPIYVRDLVPLEEARAIASWVALSGQLNATSEDYADLPPERLELLQKTLPAHGSLNVRPVDYLETEPASIWLLSEKISDKNHYVVGLYNWEKKEKGSVDYALADMGLDEEKDYYGFDYWNDTFVPVFSGRLQVELNPASCLMLALREVTDYPQVVSTSRHVTQGVTDLLSETWEESVLKGRSKVVANDQYEIRIMLPENFMEVKETRLNQAPEGTKVEVYRDGETLRVQILSPKTTTLAWEVAF